MAVNGLVIALFEMGTVERMKRFRRLRVAAIGTLLGGLGFGLTGMVMHWGWFLMTVVLWTVGEILCLPFTMAFLTDWAPPEWRGRYLSWYGATWSLAIGLNPILFLPLQAALGRPRLLAAHAPASRSRGVDAAASRPGRGPSPSASAGSRGDPAPEFPARGWPRIRGGLDSPDG